MSSETGAPRGAPRKIRVQIRFPFVAHPDRMVEDRSVSDGAYRLYGALWLVGDWHDMETRTNLATLSGKLACTVRAVQTWTKQLVSGGYIGHRYDREAHETVIDLDPEHRNERSGAQGGAGEPTFVEQANGGSSPSMYSDSITQMRDPALRAAPAKEKFDPKRARAFLDRFAAWYLRVYRRPHSTPDRGQLFATGYLLRKVDRDRLKVPAVNEATAEAVIGSVLSVSVQLKAQIWFLRNGEPVGLDEILSTKKWQVLWDRYLEEGQRLGYPMGGFDGRDESAGETAV
jgi:hypothetical protein